MVVTAFRKLQAGSGAGMYTPQGVDNYDPVATEGYFIGVDGQYYGRLNIRRVSDPGGTPSISGNIQFDVPVTGGVITVPHLGNTGGTNGYLDGLDYRLICAHLRNGRLWTCSNIAVDNTGSPTGTDTRNGVRWYELNGIASGQTPSVVQSGTLFQPSASNTTDQRHYWMGSVMVSGQGHMVLGCSTAGTNEYANAAVTGRFATDPLGTLREPVLYTAANSAYNPPADPGGSRGRRWGDYSYTSLDPCDDMTMWTIQEFCNATNSYGVRVVQLLAPPPATPTTAAPASVNDGEPSVSVTITGTQVDGSGFYDPGDGFACRISASVSGGVTVNTVTYTDPTHVTLDVSTVGASVGAQTVTITNPDGQSLTSTGGILSITQGPCTPDTDADGVCDSSDLCPNTIPGATVDADGCPDPPIPADFDNDGDVDGDDVDAFEACASGPGVPLPPACDARDFDNDGDADQSDLGIVQRCYTGENVPGDPGCAD
jgi:hypothetical protein